MGKKPHKSFPDNSEKEKIKSQSQRIKHLEKEVNRLKSELQTLNSAFKKSAEYMADESGPIPVEKLIKDAQKHKPLIESKKDAKNAPVETKEETRKRWAKWISERVSKGTDDEEK